MTTEKTKQSRGMRNNNPLNLRLTADRWLGMSDEQTDGVFCRFDSLAYGYRAALKTLDTYYRRHNLQSVADIICRWAPPSENNTREYINFVLMDMNRHGIDDRMPHPLVNRDAWKALLRSMTAMECSPREARSREVVEAIDEAYEMFERDYMK